MNSCFVPAAQDAVDIGTGPLPDVVDAALIGKADGIVGKTHGDPGRYISFFIRSQFAVIDFQDMFDELVSLPTDQMVAYGEELAEKSLREGEAEPKFTEKGRGKTARRKEGVALEWGGFWGWFFIFGGCVSEKDE